MFRADGPAAKPSAIAHLVYVEDDDRLARLTTQYLESHDVHVVMVHRGDLAVAKVLRVRSDLVLLALTLPGMSGLQIGRVLRKRINVYIIMLTGRIERVDPAMGLEGGADDYVSKPCPSEESPCP